MTWRRLQVAFRSEKHFRSDLDGRRDTWSNPAPQHAIQIECGADQREMSERLGEIAQRLALRPGLLCIKPKMIRIAQNAFKKQSGLIQPLGIRHACACQRFHKPKGAHVKSTFLARESVNTATRWIAIHEAVADKAPVTGAFKDSVYGAEHPRIGRSHEEDERHNKEGDVQTITTAKLCN